jgi:hypothetical protein
VPTLADRGCRVVSATDPHGRNLSFLENYTGPGKLKSRHNYSVSIIESLGEVLALKANAGADDPWGPRGLKTLP